MEQVVLAGGLLQPALALSLPDMDDVQPVRELYDGDVRARLGQPRLVLGHPEEVQ